MMHDSMLGVCTPLRNFTVSGGPSCCLIHLIPSLADPSRLYRRLHSSFALRNTKQGKQGRSFLSSQLRIGRSPDLWYNKPSGLKKVIRLAQESRPASYPSESSCSALSLLLPALTEHEDDAHQIKSDVSMLELTRCDEENVCESEKLRRRRIGVANKGRVPWNKGRKHSADTIQRIREKTSQAMNTPRVMAKLRVPSRHPHSDETRGKIRTTLKELWQVKHRIRGYQEFLCKDWRHCVAEAARKGGLGEEEMEWNSYSVNLRRLRLSAKESQRAKRDTKKSSETEGKSRRSAKSEEHRLKISAAIRAKWDDPEYQKKVIQGIRKYVDTRTEWKSPSTAKRKSPKPRAPPNPKSHPIPKLPGDHATPSPIIKTGGRALDLDFINAVMLGENKGKEGNPTGNDFLIPPKRKPRTHQKVNLLNRTTADGMENDDLVPPKRKPQTHQKVNRLNGTTEDVRVVEEYHTQGSTAPGKQALNELHAMENDDLVPPERKLRTHQKVNLLNRTTADLRLVVENYPPNSTAPGKQALNDPHVIEKVQSSDLLQARHPDMDQRPCKAAQRARTLIAEAERAVVILEAIAGDNEFARASLIETQRIMSEAVKFMQRVDLVEGNTTVPHVGCSESHDVASRQNTKTSLQSLALQSHIDVEENHGSMQRDDGDFVLSSKSSTRHRMEEYLQSGQDVAVGISSMTRSIILESTDIMLPDCEMKQKPVLGIESPFIEESTTKGRFPCILGLLETGFTDLRKQGRQSLKGGLLENGFTDLRKQERESLKGGNR